jgi:small nuclear ribonucleoprotein (snRNP)-like protein
MYDIEELAGKIVTIKTITGDELIATLASVDSDNKMLTLKDPMAVLINGPDVIIGPVCFSAKAEMITVRMDSLLFVTKTLPESASDYTGILKDRLPPTIVDEEAE